MRRTLGRPGHAQGCGRRQVLTVLPHIGGSRDLIGAPLPPLDFEVVAGGHIIQPVRPVLAQPHLAVLALQGGVGVSQILAAAIRAADLAQLIVDDRALRVVVLLCYRLGISGGNFLRKLKLEPDKVEASRAQIHGGERVGF